MDIIKYMFAVTLSFIVATGAFAAQMKLAISPQPVNVGEPAQLRISSDNAYPVVIRFPEVEGISWSQGASRSMRSSTINYKTVTTAESIYTFNVSKKGTYNIPPIEIQLGGKRLKTEPFTFKAYERRFNVENSGDKSKGKGAGMKDLLFAKLAVLSDKEDFFVGEEVPVEIRIYVYKGMNIQLSWPEIDVKNAVFKDYSKINKDSDKFAPCRQLSERIDGQTFNVYAFRTAFRPIMQGALDITAVENCQIKIPRERNRRRSLFEDDDLFSGFGGIMDPFNRYKVISHKAVAKKIKIMVKPLPEPPDGSNFLGLVGNWHVSTRLSSGTYKVGEPITLTLNIRGKGTLETLTAPKLKIPGFRLYPPEIDKKTQISDGIQRVEIRYVMIPLEEGPSNIDVFTSIFSTVLGAYKDFSLKKKIRVKKSEDRSSSGQVVLNSDNATAKKPIAKTREKEQRKSGILYLKKSPMGKVAVPLRRNYFVILIALLVIAPLLWLISELLHYRRQKLSSDPKLRRKLAAQAVRGSVLKRLKAASPDELDDVVCKDVVPYLNDLLALPPGTTASELVENVKDSELADCLGHIGESSYMPGAGTMDKNELKNRIHKALKRYAAIIVILFLPFNIFAGEKISEPASKSASIKSSDEALTAYDKGEFAKAAKYYKSKINPRNPDPGLLYNLGNCLCQMGDFSKALVCYERARKLAPRDSDIFENMNYVRRKLFLPEAGLARNPFELLLELRASFRPDQWMLIAAFAWLFCGIVLALRRAIPGKKWILMLAPGALCIAICLLASISQYYNGYSSSRAIIIVNNAPVYNLPSEKSGKADFKLKDGELVNIEEQRQNWARVRADNVEGWVHRDELARLWGNWSEFFKKLAINKQTSNDN